MNQRTTRWALPPSAAATTAMWPGALGAAVTLALLVTATPQAGAAPTVSRLTPPSELFRNHREAPIVARFLAGQRFDLQATVQPDDASRSISAVRFEIDGRPVAGTVTLHSCESGCTKAIPINSSIASLRAFSSDSAGVRRLTVVATQSDGQTVRASGNFEIIPLLPGATKVRNLVIMLGDGMGVAHRTAGRIMKAGYAQGKVLEPLAMDTFPVTALVKTASLNSIVTDSSPGMTAYVLGNKNDNNEEGVFPDDTLDVFDNPRIEYLSEFLHRTEGKALGIVTTADVYDSTPAGNAIHTSNRSAGTGIADQFLDDRSLTGLSVLMGGGRKWFLPSTAVGSTRAERSDYAFAADHPHSAEIVRAWGAAAGGIDKDRDLLGDFQRAGFVYAPDKTTLDATDPTRTDRLLGLFAFSNMNVALDKIDGRRGKQGGLGGTSVVDDFGFPDQPMLDEMTAKALAVLSRQPEGFVLLVEGASIDKQAHAMDSDRWMVDLLEFDRAVKVVQDFAARDGNTLVIVTADHETGGASVIGASRMTDAQLQAQATKPARDAASAPASGATGGKENMRDPVVGIYENAGFPRYVIAADGYPQSTDIDRKLLIGYGANADRHEDWRTNPLPLRDGQQPLVKQEPLVNYPANAMARDRAGNYLVTGQVPGSSSAHTGSDVPLSAFGPGAWSFTGVIDNTDVFFKLAQAAAGGVVMPAGLMAVPVAPAFTPAPASGAAPARTSAGPGSRFRSSAPAPAPRPKPAKPPAATPPALAAPPTSAPVTVGRPVHPTDPLPSKP